MLLSLYFSEIASIWWGVFFGFVLMCIFTHSRNYLPSISYTTGDFYRCNQIILVNRLTRFYIFINDSIISDFNKSSFDSFYRHKI